MTTRVEIVFTGTEQADAEARLDEYFRLHPDELERFAQDPTLAVELEWGPHD